MVEIGELFGDPGLGQPDLLDRFGLLDGDRSGEDAIAKGSELEELLSPGTEIGAGHLEDAGGCGTKEFAEFLHGGPTPIAKGALHGALRQKAHGVELGPHLADGIPLGLSGGAGVLALGRALESREIGVPEAGPDLVEIVLKHLEFGGFEVFELCDQVIEGGSGLKAGVEGGENLVARPGCRTRRASQEEGSKESGSADHRCGGYRGAARHF